MLTSHITLHVTSHCFNNITLGKRSVTSLARVSDDIYDLIGTVVELCSVDDQTILAEVVDIKHYATMRDYMRDEFCNFYSYRYDDKTLDIYHELYEVDAPSGIYAVILDPISDIP